MRWLTQDIARIIAATFDLDTAVATTRFRQNGVLYTREAFVSPIDQVIVLRISGDQPASVDFQLSSDTPMPGAIRPEGDDVLVLDLTQYGLGKLE